nr:MAG TPA: hypothetical protein [Caudoviricetes sp.]
MSVPGKLKPEIADCCFRSHCFYFFSITGKTPGHCYFMPQKYGEYFNYQNFFFLFSC